MSEIFVTKDGRQKGPFSPSEARRLIAAGEISSADLAWREGMELWEPLGKILPPELPSVSMPPPLPSQKKRFNILIPLLVLAGVVVLSMVGIAIYLSSKAYSAGIAVARQHDAARRSASSAPSSTIPSRSAPGDWRKVTLGDLTLEAPFELHKSKPALLAGTFGYIDMSAVKGSWLANSSHVWVAISIIDLGRETSPDLDKLGKEMVETVAKQIGRDVPESSVEESTVDGLPARLISAKFPLGKVSGITGERAKFPVKIMLIQSGSQLIQVFAFHMSQEPEATQITDRIIDSLSVATES